MITSAGLVGLGDGLCQIIEKSKKNNSKWG